jgi:hypothetical protein
VHHRHKVDPGPLVPDDTPRDHVHNSVNIVEPDTFLSLCCINGMLMSPRTASGAPRRNLIGLVLK